MNVNACKKFIFYALLILFAITVFRISGCIENELNKPVLRKI